MLLEETKEHELIARKPLDVGMLHFKVVEQNTNLVAECLYAALYGWI